MALVMLKLMRTPKSFFAFLAVGKRKARPGFTAAMISGRLKLREIGTGLPLAVNGKLNQTTHL